MRALKEHTEKFYGKEIQIYHTGDGTAWCFEVRDGSGNLIGESHDGFEKAESALHNARNFARWYAK